ncbi:hypothetical protein [Tabrizicola oligotrophica]|uniref:DUF3137 domain-containing protein n=1 Tax=Tabrizicola oligotrophica TaxID=2710650 RepID=A0A6M0QR22_9RHOB|nr:hypothetical protein [Tabrizicola oligotrophica]NEY89806.1 hypothetical protein [Tabrizicola oligotrophica]
MTPLSLFVAALGATAFWLAWATWQAAKARKAARAGYFDALAPAFDHIARRVEPTGFPRMTAHLGSDAFDLQAIPDSLTFRKLPALWVMVTLPTPLPVQATLDIMARPTGNEPFSHFARLPQALPCPATLPEGTGIRSDNAAAVPDLDLIAPHLRLFADPKVKELVISPKGLRLVILADEAERGRYLIFRDLEVGKTPLPKDRLLPLLDALRAIHQTLTEAK